MDNFLQTFDNDEYILIDYTALSNIAVLSHEILGTEKSMEIRKEIGNIIMSIVFYEDYDIKQILIRTDSLVGEFLFDFNRKEFIKGVDAYISYDDVTNAFMIASINKNFTMISNIQPLLSQGVNGFIAELKEKFDYDTLLYIYNSKSLKDFILNNVENASQLYFIYENEKINVLRTNKVYTYKLR